MMARAATRMQQLLAQIATALIILFALVGAIVHGLSAEVWDRVFRSIAERPGGPMTFRFILQPVMATVFAAIDGIRDARTGTPHYFWSLVTGSGTRTDQL